MAELIVIHGYPGTGKSTHSQRLVETGFNGRPVVHASAGDRLRNIRTGRATSSYEDIIRSPDTPRPLPNNIVIGALFELMPPTDDMLGLVDGFPRHLDAVEPFMQAIGRSPHQLLGCLSLEISLETSTQRVIERGRREGERIIEESLEEYNKKRYDDHTAETLPVIGQLGEFAPVFHIDAGQDIAVVQQQFHLGLRQLIGLA